MDGCHRITLSHSRIEVVFTGMDIRDRVFAYYHELVNSAEYEVALDHGIPLVLKESTDNGWHVLLSFPDIPDGYCLDEGHGRWRGVSLEMAVKTANGDSWLEREFTRQWTHEHSITGIWKGLFVQQFAQLWDRLMEVLGEPFRSLPVTVDGRGYSTADLVEVGAFLQARGAQAVPV